LAHTLSLPSAVSSTSETINVTTAGKVLAFSNVLSGGASNNTLHLNTSGSGTVTFTDASSNKGLNTYSSITSLDGGVLKIAASTNDSNCPGSSCTVSNGPIGT